MRTFFILASALVGSILGGAAADLLLDGGANTISLDNILLGALPGAALATWLAWKFSHPRVEGQAPAVLSGPRAEELISVKSSSTHR